MLNIKVNIIQEPKYNPLKLIANFAKITNTENYKINLDQNITAKEQNIAKTCIIGDHSPLEHLNYTFLIENCSRVFLSQIRTHRHISFISTSHQYINIQNFNFYIPFEIYNACEINNSIQPLNIYINISKNNYNDYIDNQNNYNINHDSSRYTLNLNTRVNLLFTGNLRAILKMLNCRLCFRNTHETQYIMYLIYNLLLTKIDNFENYCGPFCYLHNKCLESNMTCGNFWKYTDIKNLFNNQLKLANKWSNLCNL